MRVQINGELMEVEDIVKHPEYTRVGFFFANNDLSIFKLKKSLNFNAQIQPGCLNLTKQTTYDNLKVVGYGSVTPVNFTSDLQILGYSPPKTLREGQVRDITTRNCGGPLSNEFICVNGIEGSNKTNVCLGDTGSPLISEWNGKSFVVGLTGFPFMKVQSGGILELCTTGNFAARLSSPTSKDFIESVVGEDYCH